MCPLYLMFNYLSKSITDNTRLSFIHFHHIPWMFMKQNILLFYIGYVSVYLSCINRAVSKNFLNISDIYILLQQKGCKRVAKHMRSNVLFDSSQIRVVVNHIADRLIRQAVLKPVNKK